MTKTITIKQVKQLTMKYLNSLYMLYQLSHANRCVTHISQEELSISPDIGDNVRYLIDNYKTLATCQKIKCYNAWMDFARTNPEICNSYFFNKGDKLYRVLRKNEDIIKFDSLMSYDYTEGSAFILFTKAVNELLEKEVVLYKLYNKSNNKNKNSSFKTKRICPKNTKGIEPYYYGKSVNKLV